MAMKNYFAATKCTLMGAKVMGTTKGTPELCSGVPTPVVEKYHMLTTQELYVTPSGVVVRARPHFLCEAKI